MKFVFPTVLAALVAGIYSSTANAGAQRPPQFVAISFDNCSELERWQELSGFLDEMNQDGERLHLTFFVSGTNFLSRDRRTTYRAPGRASGAAMINFGGAKTDVRRRIEFISRLQAAGNEISSHAVGHFDGKQWSAADWAHEFRSYTELFENVVPNNGLAATEGFAFSSREIAGFRAPYLSRSPGLYATLKANHFRYDASGTGAPSAWPQRQDGIWRFNLAEIRLAGSSRKTLSMDYNFFVTQSLAISDPRRHAQFRKQMLDSYLAYFQANYTGNRAPVHIGHHFTVMQGDVYNEALKNFARMVCGLPEVRCVTYATLADFLDNLNLSTLSDYQDGKFPKAAPLDFAATPMP